MLIVVYVLCAIIGVFSIVNAVLVITLHRLNRKFVKKQDLQSSEVKEKNNLIN